MEGGRIGQPGAVPVYSLWISRTDRPVDPIRWASVWTLHSRPRRDDLLPESGDGGRGRVHVHSNELSRNQCSASASDRQTTA